MDMRFLESFVTVAECGSLAEAARRLNVTPVALSQRLKALERDLGRPVVSRVGRTVRPTEAGLAILAHARRLIEGARDLQAIAAHDQPAGQLKLGAAASALTGLLPAIVGDLRARHPRIEYFVRPGSSVDLYHRVLSGELDAAMIVEPEFAMPKSTGWLTLRREPLLLIVPYDTPQADPHETIVRYPFIRYDRNQWGGQIVDRYLRRHGLQVREWLELDALDAVAVLVDRGLGISVVPDWAPPWPEGTRLRRIALPGSDERRMGLLWNASSARMAAIGALVRVCAALAQPNGDGLAPTQETAL